MCRRMYANNSLGWKVSHSLRVLAPKLVSEMLYGREYMSQVAENAKYLSVHLAILVLSL